ncbi:MAG: spore coat protein CotS [Lachnospiraceae bacterium]|nr:spore coat protein CotS [Lachnospiraceae bacterium]
MNDKYEEVLKQYALQVRGVRRGRGAWIYETDQGMKSLKEYQGTLKRLEFEDQVLCQLQGFTGLKTDQYIRNREGSLVSTSEDGTRFVLKDWYGDRECSLKDGKEVCEALSSIARLHERLRKIEVLKEWNMGSILPRLAVEDMERHNRELKRARGFIRGKRKKSDFELCVMKSFNAFFEQASEAAQGIAGLWKSGEEPRLLCHGDLDQHHVLMGSGYVAVIEYNRMHLGLQMEDLYRFMRKAMEKHGWSLSLGMDMLNAYEKVLPLGEKERKCLYYLFLYPEKYWKQINYYFNANKAWIPARNMDKIIGLEAQEESRRGFLRLLQG